MVRRRQHHDTMIRLKPIQLVQKKRAVLIVNHRVEILEHHYTRRHPRALENLRDVLLLLRVALKAAHIKTRLAQRVNQRLDRMRLAVSRRADKYRPAPPRNAITLVCLARAEKLRE